jgi:N utilization substance protein B
MKSSAHLRHEARMLAVQFLYQREFHPESESADADYRVFTEELKPERKAAEFGRVLMLGVVKHQPEFDALIVRLLENWDFKRVGLVERNILRLALFELHYRNDIPPVVTLNEAVEIAKELSGDEAGRFVNGLLDRVMKSLQRPLRTATGRKLPAPKLAPAPAVEEPNPAREE